MFFKIGIINNRNIHRKTTVLESLFSKVVGLQSFSCEYCEIFKRTFFYRTPPVADFEMIKVLSLKL